MRRIFPRIQARHYCPPLDDVIDRLRIEGAARNIAPAIDPPKHTAAVDFRGRQPVVQRLHRSAGEIDDLVLAEARILGAAEMDGKRGRGFRPRRRPVPQPSVAPGVGRPIRCDDDRRTQRQPSESPRSRRSRTLSLLQVASSFASTSPVTALALFRRRCRGTARTASRIADFRARSRPVRSAGAPFSTSPRMIGLEVV